MNLKRYDKLSVSESSAYFHAITLFITLAFIVPITQSVKAAELSSASLLKDAISKRQSGNYHQAIDILEKLRTDYADHKRINIELAINHIKLKQYSRAEDIILHIQQVPLTEQEQAKLNSLLNLIERKTKDSTKRHRFSGEVTANLGVDNFVSLFPEWAGSGYLHCYDYFDGEQYLYTECYDENDSEVEDIGFESEQDRENIKTKDQETYTSQKLRLNYKYHPAQKPTLFGQTAKLIWNNDLFFTNKQVKDKSNNKYRQFKFDSSLYFFFANRWIFDMRYRSVHHFSDGKRLLENHGAQMALAVPFDSARLKFGVEVKSKSYHQMLKEKDATVIVPWLEYSRDLASNLKLSVGSRYRQSRARDAVYSYNNWNVFVGLHYYPFEKTSIFVSLNHDKLNYTIDDPDIVNWGQETKRSIAVGIKYKLNQQFVFGINGQYATNKFDMNFGDEDWNRIEAFVSYRF